MWCGIDHMRSKTVQGKEKSGARQRTGQVMGRAGEGKIGQFTVNSGQGHVRSKFGNVRNRTRLVMEINGNKIMDRLIG